MNQSIYGKAQAFVFSPFPLNLFPSSFNHIGRLEPNMAAHTSIRWTPSAWLRGGPARLLLLRDKRQTEIFHNDRLKIGKEHSPISSILLFHAPIASKVNAKVSLPRLNFDYSRGGW